MNYLAHIFLSGPNPLVQLGNFAGDWVKGSFANIQDKYPEDMVKGFRMHRFIDSFTDSNPIVLTSIARMRPVFGHYSGIVMDVVYDYYLAKNWSRYSDVKLEKFCQNFYSYCLKYYDKLPPEVQNVVPHLILTDRLRSYETLSGIQAALRTMSCKTSLPNASDSAIQLVIQNYDAYESEFTSFWQVIWAECSKMWNGE